MALYNNILLGVDLQVKHDEYTLKRAFEISKALNANLQIIHVYQGFPTYGSTQGYQVTEIENKIVESARQVLNDLVSGYDVASEQLFIVKGLPKTEIAEHAKKLKCDLIIVGAHNRHGINAFIGSTANGVIQNAKCDVITIHTQD